MGCSPSGSSVHGISRQEYCSGLPSPPGDLLDPGIDPGSPAWQADSLVSEPPPGDPQSRRPTNQCVESVGTGKLPFGNIKSKNEEKEDIYLVSKYLSIRYLLVAKRKLVTLFGER